MKKLFSLLTLALLTMSAWAQTTVTIDLTDQGYSNQQEVTSVSDADGLVTITFDKGSNQNAPKWYDNGASVRVYGGSTITVSSEGTTPITGVTFTFGSSDGSNAITSNVGTFKSPTWTGSANEVVFTIGGTTGNRRFTQIEVTLGGQVVETVADPVFTPGDGTSFIESQEITLTCGTADATISYSTNGLAWNTYSEPFTITETTTVYAKAAKNGVESNVVSANYTKVVPAEGNPVTFKSATDQGNGSTTRGEWTVVKNGVTLHCTDGTVYTENYRIYGGSTFTISSDDKTAGKIVKIEFVNTDGSRPISNLTPNTGVLTNEGAAGTWVGDETNAVAFSVSAQARASKIIVYVTGDVPVEIEVAAPSIPASQNFDESITVEITNNDAEATVMYNTDGATWQNYTGALTFTETTTLQAKAVKGENESTVVEATYTKNEPASEITTLAQARALEDNTEFTFGGNVVVVYKNGSNLWVKDETASGLIYGSGLNNFEQGTVLNSGWSGLKVMYQEIIPEFKNPQNVTASEQEKVTVEPTVVELSAIDATKMNDYIRINDVTIDSISSTDNRNYYANGMVLRNQFGGITLEVGKTYSLIGLVTAYNGVPQVYITEVVNAPQPTVVDVNNIAEAIALDEGTQFTMYNDVVVTYHNGKRLFIRDTKGNSGMIYDTNSAIEGTFENGQVLSDGWTATYQYFNGNTPEFTNPEGVEAAGTETRDASPFKRESIDSTNVNEYVILKGVTLQADTTDTNIFYTANGVQICNFFSGVEIPAVEEGKTYDVTGIVILSKAGLARVYITEMTEAAAAGLRGDVNNDGDVNIGDVTTLIDYLLNPATEINAANADVTLEGDINIGDVTALIDYLLSNAWPE